MSSDFDGHTPGPWRVASWHDDFGDDLFEIEARVTIKPDSIYPDGSQPFKIASVRDGHADNETALANARLIAAAPDLLAERDRLAETVKELVEALLWYGEQARLARLIHSEGDEGRRALAFDGGDRARAALAKARGQA